MTERGRGRVRAWHTRMEARQRRRGGSEKNRQDLQRAGRWEGKQAREGAQGGKTGVARRRAGGTRDQGGTEKEKKPKRNLGQTPRHQRRTNRGGGAAREEEGEAGSQLRRKGTHRLAQKNTMPLTRIEPYLPSCPTFMELMEGRPAGEDDGGAASKGYLGRTPKSAYTSKDRAEALR